MPLEPSEERHFYEQLEMTCLSVLKIFEQGSDPISKKPIKSPASGDLTTYQNELTAQMGSLDEKLQKLLGERSRDQ